MTFNQSRAYRSEQQYRKPGRSAGSNQQRTSSGTYGSGPAPSPSPSLSSNRSFKKSNNAQGGQSRVNSPAVNSLESSHASAVHGIQNGAHVQSHLQGASNAPVSSSVVKPAELPSTQRSSRTLPKAPTFQPATMTSESSLHTTPAKVTPTDASKAFSSQYGSISPGFMNGMQSELISRRRQIRHACLLKCAMCLTLCRCITPLYFTRISSSISPFPYTLHPQTQHSSSFSSSSSTSIYFDYLNQFSPFCSSGKAAATNSSNFINSNERRRITIGLSKIIKLRQGFLLKGFSNKFCPFLIVEIMKHLESRDTAFAFFKFAFRDDSETTVRSSCTVAHILAAHNLRFLAQDVISWMVRRIGKSRTEGLMEFMWEGHGVYESNFSVLDTLMRAFLVAGMVTRAMEVLTRMREIRVRPSSSAMTILFKLLIRIGDYGSVWKLFRDMIREGPCPSNYTFNAMIFGFCRRGHVRIGESLLNVMGKFKCNPDVYGYNILINSYCTGGQTLDAFALVHLMKEQGCSPSIVTFTTIVNALCAEGNMVDARKVFDGIHELGLSPGLAICNCLISGYVKARDLGQAKLFYQEMILKGITPDAVTFNILVAGHYKYGREEDGHRLLRELAMLDLLPDQSLCDISVAALCWAGHLDEAMEFLENMLEKGMTPSVVAFNSVIAAYGRAGLEENAYEVFKVMTKFSLTPSCSTYSSLLMCLSKKGRLEEARGLLNKMMEKGFPINRVAFTVLLDGYFRKGNLAMAQDLWNEMEYWGISPDAITFSVFINGLSKAGFVEEAYDLFIEMPKKGLVPNNFVYNSLIGGFCNIGKLHEALKLEREMRYKGLLPDIFTSNIIINGFCKLSRMKSAFDAFLDIHWVGLAPDIVTYNTLIGGYCEAFDMVKVSEFMNNMHASGMEPDIRTYNIQIHSFCRNRKMSRAVKMLDELVSAGIVPDTVTYNTMMKGVCTDILDRAMIITAKLLKMAFIPNVITTNVLLSQFCKQGMPDRALMWAQKLDEISFDFDEASYKIMERAYRDIQEDVVFFRATSGKSLLLEFLMYITYGYFSRNKLQQKTNSETLKFIV